MARVTVWLFIESSDMDANQMSAAIGVPADKTWRKGDARGRTGKVYGTDSWTLESRSDVNENPVAVGESIQKCLDSILNRIQGHTDSFRAIASGRTCGIYVGVSTNAAPAVEFTAETIRKMSTLGVGIELDLML